MPFKGLDRFARRMGRPDSETGSYQIIADCFFEAVKDICDQDKKYGNKVRRIISRYVHHNPHGDVLIETQTLFSAVAPMCLVIIRLPKNKWSETIKMVQCKFNLSLREDIWQKYQDELDLFFKNLIGYNN